MNIGTEQVFATDQNRQMEQVEISAAGTTRT
jgi:hypothetical protein